MHPAPIGRCGPTEGAAPLREVRWGDAEVSGIDPPRPSACGHHDRVGPVCRSIASRVCAGDAAGYSERPRGTTRPRHSRSVLPFYRPLPHLTSLETMEIVAIVPARFASTR